MADDSTPAEGNTEGATPPATPAATTGRTDLTTMPQDVQNLLTARNKEAADYRQQLKAAQAIIDNAKAESAKNAAAALAEQGKFKELYETGLAELAAAQQQAAQGAKAQVALDALLTAEADTLAAKVGAAAVLAAGLTAETPLQYRLSMLRGMSSMATAQAAAAADPATPPAPPTPPQTQVGAGMSASKDAIQAQINAVFSDYGIPNHEKRAQIKELQAKLSKAV